MVVSRTGATFFGRPTLLFFSFCTMTHEEFIRFEQQLLSLCGEFGVWVKSQQQYSEQPKDNIHYRDILLKAKINGKLHHLPAFTEDIAESASKL